MPFFNIVAATNENTVVTEYEPVKARSDSYQSEAELEKEFIRLLCEQGYEYLPIHTEEDLIQNLRARLEELNDYHFSDTEWERFFSESIANKNEGIFAVASVPMAKLYYDEFRKQINADPTKGLKIAVIYSYAPNEEEVDFCLYRFILISYTHKLSFNSNLEDYKGFPFWLV